MFELETLSYDIKYFTISKSIYFSFFHKIGNNTLYVTLSCLFRVVAGIATGFVCVPSFGALTKLVPTRIALVTALAEAALNGSQALGPFLGSLLYNAGGYRYSLNLVFRVLRCIQLYPIFFVHKTYEWLLCFSRPVC